MAVAKGIRGWIKVGVDFWVANKIMGRWVGGGVRRRSKGWEPGG